MAAAALVAVSCGDDDPYDTSCGGDADCAVVVVGENCGCESCRRTSINAKEVDRYNEDREDDSIECDDVGDEVPCSGIGAPCVEPTAFCANGKCALR